MIIIYHERAAFRTYTWQISFRISSIFADDALYIYWGKTYHKIKADVGILEPGLWQLKVDCEHCEPPRVGQHNMRYACTAKSVWTSHISLISYITFHSLTILLNPSFNWIWILKSIVPQSIQYNPVYNRPHFLKLNSKLRKLQSVLLWGLQHTICISV